MTPSTERRERRAAIYANILTLAGQREESVVDQVQVARDYAEAQGYVVVDVYREATQDADDAVGPALNRLLADAHGHLFDTVIVAAPGLLAREHSAAEFTAAQLGQHGVAIESIEAMPGT